VLSADSGESILPVIDADRRICSNKRNQRDAREEPEAFRISTHRQSDSMKAVVGGPLTLVIAPRHPGCQWLTPGSARNPQLLCPRRQR
jgi:hypothetical protein